jgi:hypothetical protein
MKIETNETTEFTDLHDLFCDYESRRVKLNYDKKELLFDLTVYGNYPNNGLKKLFRDSFSTIDGQFKKHILINLPQLKGYLTSKTHKKEIKEFILSILNSGFKIFTKNLFSSENLIHLTPELIDNIQLKDTEKNRYKKFLNEILKSGKIPKQVKPYKLYDCSLKINVTIKEFLKLSETLTLNQINKYFKADTSYSNFKQYVFIDSLNQLTMCKDFGFYIDENLEQIKKIKSMDIFNQLDNEASEAV